MGKVKETKLVQDILHTLAELKTEVKERYKAEIKGIFGSYVRGKEKEGSDIDVLVEFDEGANLIDFVGLSLFLEEKLNLRVDVVPESAIRKEIREDILREAAYL
jgi:predicted nucleotidyltransferase